MSNHPPRLAVVLALALSTAAWAEFPKDACHGTERERYRAQTEALRFKPLSMSLTSERWRGGTCYLPELMFAPDIGPARALRLQPLCTRQELQRFALTLASDGGYLTVDVARPVQHADPAGARAGWLRVVADNPAESWPARSEDEGNVRRFRYRPADVELMYSPCHLPCVVELHRIDDPAVPAKYFVGPMSCRGRLTEAASDAGGYVQVDAHGLLQPGEIDAATRSSWLHSRLRELDGAVLLGELLPRYEQPRTLP